MRAKTFILRSASILLMAVALSACGTTGQQVLTNVQNCNRDYNGVVTGGITGGSFSGSVAIKCRPLGELSEPGTELPDAASLEDVPES